MVMTVVCTHNRDPSGLYTGIETGVTIKSIQYKVYNYLSIVYLVYSSVL